MLLMKIMRNYQSLSGYQSHLEKPCAFDPRGQMRMAFPSLYDFNHLHCYIVNLSPLVIMLHS